MPKLVIDEYVQKVQWALNDLESFATDLENQNIQLMDENKSLQKELDQAQDEIETLAFGEKEK